MGENKFTPEQLQALLQYASKRLGTTPEKLAQTVQSGGLSALSASLSPGDAAKLDAAVSDKKQAEQLLNSAEAQQLIQKILQNRNGN